MRRLDAIGETAIGLMFIIAIVYAITHPLAVLAAIVGGLYN